MKLLHMGDLHLDSPFSASDPFLAERRREGQRDLLRRVFACAKEEACDLILIAGDLFDGKFVTPETTELVLRLFGESTCPIVISPGNHDPYVAGSFWQTTKLPSHVFVFSQPTLSAFSLDGLNARVWGYAFSSASLTENPLVGVSPLSRQDGRWELLCAHGDLDAPLSHYAPLSTSDITRLGFDYAALGHVHRPAETGRGSDRVRYCGFGEGRSFDETGDGGVLLVTLEDGMSPKIERRILSDQRYELGELDLSDATDEEAIWAAIRAHIASYGQGTHLRLSLSGTVERLPDLAQIERELGGALASLELRDETLPVANDSVLQKDVGLRGAFYRSLYPRLTDSDPQVRRRAVLALQIGLAAIDGRKIPERRDGQ